MILRDDERAMLDGKEGKGVQKAMELLVRYGEALGAECFVDTSNVGGGMIADLTSMKRYGSFDAVVSHRGLDSDETVEIPKVKVPSTHFTLDFDPENYELMGRTKEEYDLQQEDMKHAGKLGVQLLCTCAPYLVGNVPVKGEHCAWMESSAVAYINGVLGARTNCEGIESATAAMLTGKIPYWGYHIPENRRGTHLIKVETDVRDMEDWGLLGYYVGKVVQDKVPVITNIDMTPTRDMLKHFGAAAAASGGVEMYHIPGITAEANSVEEAFGGNKPVEVFNFGKNEKQYAYDLLNSIGTDRDVDFIMLGCPAYSVEQLWYLCRLLEGKHIKDAVNLWVFVPRAIKDVAERNGFEKIIKDAGGLLMSSCCPSLGQFKPKNSRVMATDSAKQAHYLPNIVGIQAWYGSMGECVNAALTGKWEGKLK